MISSNFGEETIVEDSVEEATVAEETAVEDSVEEGAVVEVSNAKILSKGT